MKKISAQRYWNERSFKFANYYENPTRFDLIFRIGIFRRLERSIKVCKLYKSATVLDIGSGPGINSVNLLKHSQVSKVTGIDFAPEMVKYANEFTRLNNLSRSCEFITGDFLEYDWKEQKFDVTLALGVFDYINNPHEFIIKMAGITNKAFVISWPGNGLRMMLRKVRYTCPVYHYNENDIRVMHHHCMAVKKLELFKGNAGWISVAYL